MSWARRFGGTLGQFSPFARSPTQGSAKVSDADFSYITADDLKKHGADGVERKSMSGEPELGPPRDTDALVLRNNKQDYVVHFPAHSIAKGELTIGQVREHAAKKLGKGDPRRVKLLYRGKNLKDDSKTCRSEGLQHEAALLCTAGEATSTSASDDEEDEDEQDGLEDGADNQIGVDGEARRRRNRGKKSKKKNRRVESAQQASGTSTPSSSQPPGRAQSPRPPPPTPVTPMDKLQQLRTILQTYLPQVEAFKANPPSEPAKLEFEHKRLEQTILQQVLLKTDAVETEGDLELRARRKELVKEAQDVLNKLDATKEAGGGKK